MSEDWKNGGFGIYLHWPFCEAKCPYCDFNSHVARSIDQGRWARAFLAEIDRIAEQTKGRLLNSVFFGGGTPSLMSPDTVAAILDRVRDRWLPANDIEITLEANPSSVEAGRFRGYADAGVNRVSLGIQALNDRDLKRLGRIHTADDAQRAFDVARTVFDRVSFDMIYARQDQTLTDWRAELTEALSMAVDHLSLYQLTIEAGTAFGDRYKAGKLRGLPEDDAAADMYEATQEICAAHDLPAYEVSNHARDGAESRHNLIYWRYGDYVGIGPGAHGRLTLAGQKYATETELSPDRWLAAAETGRGESVRAAVLPQDMAGEYLMMGLRINEGIDMARYGALAGMPLKKESLTDLAGLGMVVTKKGRLIATPAGRLVLNAVIERLLPDQ